VASAADIVAARGNVCYKRNNATNATNTVNVGVTNDAATATPVFLSWVLLQEISLPKFQVLIYLCSFYWYFINRFSGNGANISYSS
jgi:hypothetical protein